jgi:excisionase family DNA binding protein
MTTIPPKRQTVEQFIKDHFEAESRPRKATVWRWIRDGKLRATKLGRHYYITADAAASFLEKGH